MAPVADLYHDGPRRFLVTFPELDHYPERAGDVRRGYWPYSPGTPPVWPRGGGPRVFAYLKHSPQLPAVLAGLAGCGASALVYVDGVDPSLRARFAGPTLSFADGAVDLRAVASEASLAVTNANIGTMTALMLGGVPQFCLPLTLEQFLVARAVETAGAGRVFLPDDRMPLEQALRAMLVDPRCGVAARSFAERHRGFDPARQLAELLEECDLAMAGSSG